MKSPLKLYWVETPSPEENCFVAARSKRAAAKYEEDGTGFDPGDCNAVLIRSLDPAWTEQYRGKSSAEEEEENRHEFYVQPEDVHQLGIKWRVIEGDEVFEYNGIQYVQQGVFNYLSSLGDDPRNMVIRSVSDLLEIIARDAPGPWIFRGHSSCRWALMAGVHRLTKGLDANLDQIVAYERSLLSEFKRRARIFLQSKPSSDWEWMVLAQHFGLPTGILDWTENPLIGLFFAVWDTTEVDNDGMLYAYRHGAHAIDIESTSDPLDIKQIELVRPPHLDQRVIAQQSIFTAEPPSIPQGGRKESDLKYWYVSVNDKEYMRWELRKLGISESSLFPGLASLAAEIKNGISFERILKQA